MSFSLLFTEQADESMDRLEADPGRHHVLEAVERTLDRIETNPSDPRLGTRSFVTEVYGGVRATPVRVDDWHVFWQPGPRSDEITIIEVLEMSF
jgi:hypothetical protein